MLDCEENFLHTTDPDYLNNKSIYEDDKDKKNDKPINRDPNKILVDTLRRRIDLYFYVVTKNMKDTLPKIIGNFLINSSQQDLHFVLFNAITQQKQLVERFSEPSSIINEREQLEKMVATLKKAEKKLISDPNLMTSRYDNTNIYEEIEQKNQEFIDLTRSQMANNHKPPVASNQRLAPPEISESKSHSRGKDQNSSRNVSNNNYSTNVVPPQADPRRPQQQYPNTNQQNVGSIQNQNKIFNEDPFQNFQNLENRYQPNNQQQRNPQNEQPKAKPVSKNNLFG